MSQKNEGPTSKPQVRRSVRTRAAKPKSKTPLSILTDNVQTADVEVSSAGDDALKPVNGPLKPVDESTTLPSQSVETTTKSESPTSLSWNSEVVSSSENDGQELETSGVASQSNAADELPRIEDLVVRTTDGLRPAENGDLFRRSDGVIWHLKLEKRTVAVACGCGQADCCVLVQVGTHGNHARNASAKCVHCGSGPFSGPATANKHWRDGTCKNKRGKGVVTIRSELNIVDLADFSCKETRRISYQLRSVFLPHTSKQE